MSNADGIRPVVHLDLDARVADFLAKLDPDELYEFTVGDKIVFNDPATPISSWQMTADPIIMRVVGRRPGHFSLRTGRIRTSRLCIIMPIAI
jgi:hypothetical protein